MRALLCHGVGGSGVSLSALMATPDLMDALLHDFGDLFAAHEGLPPACRHDHCIHLLPGIALVIVHPYRYPPTFEGRDRTTM